MTLKLRNKGGKRKRTIRNTLLVKKRNKSKGKQKRKYTKRAKKNTKNQRGSGWITEFFGKDVGENIKNRWKKTKTTHTK